MAVFWLDPKSAICEAFSVLSRIMLDQSQFHRTVSMMRHKNVLRKIQIYTYLQREERGRKRWRKNRSLLNLESRQLERRVEEFSFLCLSIAIWHDPVPPAPSAAHRYWASSQHCCVHLDPIPLKDDVSIFLIVKSLHLWKSGERKKIRSQQLPL